MNSENQGRTCRDAWKVEADDTRSPEERLAALDYIIEHEASHELLKTAFFNRGIIKIKKKLSESALCDFTDAIRLRHWLSLTDHAYAQRARICDLRGKPSEEIEACTEEIRRWPESHFAHYYRARAWAAEGDFYRATADYERAIRFAPDNWSSFHADAKVDLWRSAADNVIAELMRELRSNPGAVATMIGIGRAHELRRETNDVARAIEYYQLAIEEYRTRPIQDRSTNEKAAFVRARDGLKRLGAEQC